jgi:hypothetical protein
LGCLPVWSVLRRPLFAIGISLEIRDKLAHPISDKQAADQLEKARQKFFKSMRGQTLKSG